MSGVTLAGGVIAPLTPAFGLGMCDEVPYGSAPSRQGVAVPSLAAQAAAKSEPCVGAPQRSSSEPSACVGAVPVGSPAW